MVETNGSRITRRALLITGGHSSGISRVQSTMIRQNEQQPTA